jgi:hypothetical protein
MVQPAKQRVRQKVFRGWSEAAGAPWGRMSTTAGRSRGLRTFALRKSVTLMQTLARPGLPPLQAAAVLAGWGLSPANQCWLSPCSGLCVSFPGQRCRWAPQGGDWASACSTAAFLPLTAALVPTVGWRLPVSRDALPKGPQVCRLKKLCSYPKDVVLLYRATA